MRFTSLVNGALLQPGRALTTLDVRAWCTDLGRDVVIFVVVGGGGIVRVASRVRRARALVGEVSSSTRSERCMILNVDREMNKRGDDRAGVVIGQGFPYF